MFYGARNIEIEEEKECWGFTEEQMEETQKQDLDAERCKQRIDTTELQHLV